MEHILPKTHHKENWAHFDSDEHKFYRNKLGNLCLLDGNENSQAGQSSFEDKKTGFLSSSFLLTKEVGKMSSWTKEAIEQRQTELSNIAVSVWSI